MTGIIEEGKSPEFAQFRKDIEELALASSFTIGAVSIIAIEYAVFLQNIFRGEMTSEEVRDNLKRQVDHFMNNHELDAKASPGTIPSQGTMQ